ncbi:MAG: hypothetical protein KDD60_08450 [Bdellovibrionales bacterium]|nr:hypothetical protein [Bdellovibrionales bacterium]
MKTHYKIVDLYSACLFAACLLSLTHLYVPTAIAEDNQSSHNAPVAAKMKEAYQPFLNLQEYLLDADRFQAPENRAKILGLIEQMDNSFHEIAPDDARYSKIPGFQSHLTSLKTMLSDVQMSLKEGNSSWAFWRVKTISNHCITCHTSYAPEVQFIDESTQAEKLNALQRGEFFLSSRQFEKAREAFYEAAAAPSMPRATLDALRKWLILYTRVSPEPKEALQKLQALFSREKNHLTLYEQEVIQNWEGSLQRWTAEPKQKLEPLEAAEKLLKSALQMDNPLFDQTDEVNLLRATALLHETLGTPELEVKKRRRALYLLGLCYSKLPLFFINELPDIYLEQCIREYPNTEEAKKSYRLLHEVITLGFTGSSGTHIPDDVALRLHTLHDIAYGVPTLEGKV